MKKYIKPRLTEEKFLMSSSMLIGSEIDEEITDGGAAKFGYFYFEDEEDDE